MTSGSEILAGGNVCPPVVTFKKRRLDFASAGVGDQNMSRDQESHGDSLLLQLGQTKHDLAENPTDKRERQCAVVPDELLEGATGEMLDKYVVFALLLLMAQVRDELRVSLVHLHPVELR